MQDISRQLIRELKESKSRNRKIDGTTSYFTGIENYKIGFKYYIVEAKSGHVRDSRYTKVLIPIVAINKKEAAKKVRNLPRIKRDHKDYIFNISEVTYEEYNNQMLINSENMYFKCKNIQEQNKYCCDSLEIFEEEVKSTNKMWDKKYSRTDRIEYSRKKEKMKKDEIYRFEMLTI